MLPGVYQARKKDGSVYYRANISHRGRHVSLGSFPTEALAHRVYEEAGRLYSDSSLTLLNYRKKCRKIPFDKAIIILNHRDNDLYIGTPIYLRSGYFSYFLTETMELKFDNDDLFYYSSHRILAHGGHLYVNDYGMQYGILNRYGIKNYAVAGKDYTFANGDSTDFRYSNIIVLSHYHGVSMVRDGGTALYLAKIHFNGDWQLGSFSEETDAALIYNKAVDYARDHGICKDYIENYISELTPREYADRYSQLSLPRKYKSYVRGLASPK